MPRAAWGPASASAPSLPEPAPAADRSPPAPSSPACILSAEDESQHMNLSLSPPARRTTSSSSARARACSACCWPICADLQGPKVTHKHERSLKNMHGNGCRQVHACDIESSRKATLLLSGRLRHAYPSPDPPKLSLQVSDSLLQHLAAACRRRFELPLQFGLCTSETMEARGRVSRAVSWPVLMALPGSPARTAAPGTAASDGPVCTLDSHQTSHRRQSQAAPATAVPSKQDKGRCVPTCRSKLLH
jgi:hypothetical protein